MFILTEFALSVISIGIAYAIPNWGSRWFERGEQMFFRLAGRRVLSVVLVGVLALVARIAVLPVLPVPVPGINDEFGYQLAADTFAHGRLTNPTHPMWIHFESFHINQRPTNAPMFYPAQGLIMALGQVIGGHPFVGVWLSIGLMCAAICWMLQGWLPPAWALAGGLLAVVRLGTFSYWANSYWGGAVAAIGGALVLGALPRIRKHLRVRDALLMGLGLAILANSRPYESLFFGLPIGVALWVWLLGKNAPPLRLTMRRVILPLGLVIVVTAGAMGYFFWRTTGTPFRTPYLVNVDTYAAVPYFPWQSLKSVPEYHHPVMRNFYLGWPLEQYNFARSHPGLLILLKTVSLWSFFLGPALTVPLLLVAIPHLSFWKGARPETRFLLLVCGASFFGLMLPIYFTPHYAAPLTCAIYALLLLALRRVRNWRWGGQGTGLAVVRAVPAICMIMLVLHLAAPALHLSSPPASMHSWDSPQFQMVDRARVLAQLQGLEGRQLAIVRYGPDHPAIIEWVYNEGEIDGAQVVWARDMGRAQNQELIEYFKDRDVWLIEPDENPPKVSPYSVPLHPESAASLPGAP